MILLFKVEEISVNLVPINISGTFWFAILGVVVLSLVGVAVYLLGNYGASLHNKVLRWISIVGSIAVMVGIAVGMLNVGLLRPFNYIWDKNHEQAELFEEAFNVETVNGYWADMAYSLQKNKTHDMSVSVVNLENGVGGELQIRAVLNTDGESVKFYILDGDKSKAIPFSSDNLSESDGYIRG